MWFSWHNRGLQSYIADENVILHRHWKSVGGFSKKLNTELPNGPTTALLGMQHPKLKNRYPNKYIYMQVDSNTICNSQKGEVMQISINKWTDK